MKITGGKSDVIEYIKELQHKTSKEDRIKSEKISAYFDKLKEIGQKLGEPFVKKINIDLWELRPLKDRFMFAYIKDDTIVVLTYFRKSTQTTPKSEIERAEIRLKRFKEKGDDYDGMGRIKKRF